MKSKFKNSAGFTLIELLVVISIVGILSAVVMASVNQARKNAKITKATAQVREIRKAIVMLEGDSGEWPGHKTIDDIENGASGNEMWDLNIPEAGIVSTDGNFGNWSGPYLSMTLVDPWGNNYFFDTDYDIDPDGGQRWATVVGSFGPNGIGQNVYDDDNIVDVLVAE